jgi:hypothetical protein
MNRVTIDPGRRICRAEAGVRWEAVVDPAVEHARTHCRVDNDHDPELLCAMDALGPRRRHDERPDPTSCSRSV